MSSQMEFERLLQEKISAKDKEVEKWKKEAECLQATVDRMAEENRKKDLANNKPMVNLDKEDYEALKIGLVRAQARNTTAGDDGSGVDLSGAAGTAELPQGEVPNVMQIGTCAERFFGRFRKTSFNMYRQQKIMNDAEIVQNGLEILREVCAFIGLLGGLCLLICCIRDRTVWRDLQIGNQFVSSVSVGCIRT